jgi:hypothetical protein
LSSTRIAVFIACSAATGCLVTTHDLDFGPDAGPDAGASCAAPFMGGCSNPDTCTTQTKYTCVADPANSTASCLGVAGAQCQSGCDCLSGACAVPLQTDCFPPQGCPPPGPAICGTSPIGGRCLTDTDCSYGVCGGPDAGPPNHVPRACCASTSQQCRADSDCCPGMQCATDNTGCRVGPTPTCTIDGGVWASGAMNPANDCQYCDPYTLPNSWRNLGAKGEYEPPCGDGGHPGGVGPGINYCCNGVCQDTCSL